MFCFKVADFSCSQMRDISRDPEWEAAYGIAIPVLSHAALDGSHEVRSLCFHCTHLPLLHDAQYTDARTWKITWVTINISPAVGFYAVGKISHKVTLLFTCRLWDTAPSANMVNVVIGRLFVAMQRRIPRPAPRLSADRLERHIVEALGSNS